MTENNTRCTLHCYAVLTHLITVAFKAFSLTALEAMNSCSLYDECVVFCCS